MTEPIRFIAAKATPVPGVGTQAANDLNDTVNGQRKRPPEIWYRQTPVILSRTLIALAVIVTGVLIMKTLLVNI